MNNHEWVDAVDFTRNGSIRMRYVKCDKCGIDSGLAQLNQVSCPAKAQGQEVR